MKQLVHNISICSICGGILVTVGAMSGMLAKRVSWMERDTSSAHNYKALKNFFNCESTYRVSRYYRFMQKCSPCLNFLPLILPANAKPIFDDKLNSSNIASFLLLYLVDVNTLLSTPR